MSTAIDPAAPAPAPAPSFAFLGLTEVVHILGDDHPESDFDLIMMLQSNRVAVVTRWDRQNRVETFDAAFLDRNEAARYIAWVRKTEPRAVLAMA